MPTSRNGPLAGLLVIAVWGAEITVTLGTVLVVLEEVSSSPEWLWTAVASDAVIFGAMACLASAALASLALTDPPGAVAEAGAASGSLLRDQAWAALSLTVLGLAAASARAGHGTVALTAAAVASGFTATRAAASGLRRLPALWRRSVLFVVSLSATTGIAAGSLLWWRPDWLQTATLVAVDAAARLVYPDVTTDVAATTIRVGTFRVRLSPLCSGIESFALGLTVLVPYLVLSRSRLRFPRALVLLPATLAALFATNVLRVVVLLGVGQRSRPDAVNAFHSSAGWLLFALAAAVVVPLTERVLSLRREEGASPTLDASGRTAPFLAPFVGLTATAFLLSALSVDTTPLAGLRYVAAVAAALLWPLRETDSPSTRVAWPAALAAGAGVALLYVLASAQKSIAEPVTREAFPSLTVLAGYALVTPYVEELAFRGYLLRRLAASAFTAVRYEEVGALAVGLSSWAFGMLHGSVLLATGAGVAFALVARRFGGLRAALVAHTTANVLLLVAALLSGRPDWVR